MEPELFILVFAGPYSESGTQGPRLRLVKWLRPVHRGDNRLVGGPYYSQPMELLPFGGRGIPNRGQRTTSVTHCLCFVIKGTCRDMIGDVCSPRNLWSIRFRFEMRCLVATAWNEVRLLQRMFHPRFRSSPKLEREREREMYMMWCCWYSAERRFSPIEKRTKYPTSQKRPPFSHRGT
jgi:hypothetical protein